MIYRTRDASGGRPAAAATPPPACNTHTLGHAQPPPPFPLTGTTAATTLLPLPLVALVLGAGAFGVAGFGGVLEGLGGLGSSAGGSLVEARACNHGKWQVAWNNHSPQGLSHGGAGHPLVAFKYLTTHALSLPCRMRKPCKL